MPAQFLLRHKFQLLSALTLRPLPATSLSLLKYAHTLSPDQPCYADLLDFLLDLYFQVPIRSRYDPNSSSNSSNRSRNNSNRSAGKGADEVLSGLGMDVEELLDFLVNVYVAKLTKPTFDSVSVSSTDYPIEEDASLLLLQPQQPHEQRHRQPSYAYESPRHTNTLDESKYVHTIPFPTPQQVPPVVVFTQIDWQRELSQAQSVLDTSVVQQRPFKYLHYYRRFKTMWQESRRSALAGTETETEPGRSRRGMSMGERLELAHPGELDTWKSDVMALRNRIEELECAVQALVTTERMKSFHLDMHPIIQKQHQLTHPNHSNPYPHAPPPPHHHHQITTLVTALTRLSSELSTCQTNLRHQITSRTKPLESQVEWGRDRVMSLEREVAQKMGQREGGGGGESGVKEGGEGGPVRQLKRAVRELEREGVRRQVAVQCLRAGLYR